MRSFGEEEQRSASACRARPLSADCDDEIAEQNARKRFKAVAAMVKLRKMDQTKRSADLAAFAANQSQYGSYNRYVWSVCGAEYDNSNPA